MKDIKSMKSSLTSCAVILLIALSSAANAQTSQTMQHDMDKMPMTGDADYDFAMMMKSHHQKGIEMAKQELKNGKDAEMKGMAKKIVSDQTKEIANLDKWMSSHKPQASKGQ